MGSKVSNSQAKKEQILLRAASLSSRPEGIRCGRVTELMRDAVGCGASIEAEIFRAAYGDPKGQKYWETHFSEVVPIVSLADLLSVHLAVSGENIEDENMEEMQLSIVSALYYAINSLEILRPLGCDSGSIDPTVAARWLLSKPKREYFVPESLRQHLRSNQPRTIKHAKAMQARASLSHRKRGRKPMKLEQTKKAMMRDLQEGQFTADELEKMLEKDLTATYGVSRETARKARNEVMSVIARS
jgi:hypothetical protein